ncbi:hypothetical protein ACWC3Y_09660 [Streptomyces sp. NPDC001296]
MNHTGVCGTGSRLHAFRKAESYVAVGWPVAGRSLALTRKVSHAAPTSLSRVGGTQQGARPHRGAELSDLAPGARWCPGADPPLSRVGGAQEGARPHRGAELSDLAPGARWCPGADGRNHTAPFPAKPPSASGVSPCERAFFPLLFPAWLRLRDD